MTLSLPSFSPKRRFRTTGISLAIAPALMLGVLCTQTQGELIGEYLFEGNFDNALTEPGSLGSLTLVGSNAGSHSFTGNGWEWSGATSPGIGLNLEIGTVLSSYTVAIAFQFSNVADLPKVLTFGALDSDLGLYVNGGALALYNEEGFGEGGGTVQANRTMYVIITRTEEGAMNVYLDGNTTPVFGIVGDTNLAIQGELNFFLDDNVTASEDNDYPEFAPNGSVSKIMVWDSALTTKSEISGAFQAVPEPSTTALMVGLGFAGFILNRARRKRSI